MLASSKRFASLKEQEKRDRAKGKKRDYSMRKKENEDTFSDILNTITLSTDLEEQPGSQSSQEKKGKEKETDEDNEEKSEEESESEKEKEYEKEPKMKRARIDGHEDDEDLDSGALLSIQHASAFGETLQPELLKHLRSRKGTK